MGNGPKKSNRKRLIVIAILGIALVALLAYLWVAFVVGRSIKQYYRVRSESVDTPLIAVRFAGRTLRASALAPLSRNANSARVVGNEFPFCIV